MKSSIRENPGLQYTCTCSGRAKKENQFCGFAFRTRHSKHSATLVKTREGFLRKNIVAVSFFQNCAIHQYSIH